MSKAADHRAEDRAVAAALEGRRIVRAVPHAGWDVENKNLRRWVHCWRLHLDDGTVVMFSTEETDHGSSYGTDIVLIRKKKETGDHG